MPLQRRLPKVGFNSRTKKFNAEVRLSEIESMTATTIDLKSLIDENIVPVFTKSAKIILSGKIEKAVTIVGIKVTAGAAQLITAVGGKVEV